MDGLPALTWNFTTASSPCRARDLPGDAKQAMSPLPPLFPTPTRVGAASSPAGGERTPRSLPALLVQEGPGLTADGAQAGPAGAGLGMRAELDLYLWEPWEGFEP